MIIDSLSNLDKYEKILPALPKALEKLESLQDNWKSEEKYFFDGGFIFFQNGQTKPLENAQFEAHRKYIDVQVMLKGSEYLAWNKITDLIETIAYSSDRDVQKFSGEATHTMKISEGMAYVAFPWDGHQAVFHLTEPLKFAKAVIKLEIIFK